MNYRSNPPNLERKYYYQRVHGKESSYIETCKCYSNLNINKHLNHALCEKSIVLMIFLSKFNSVFLQFIVSVVYLPFV